MDWTRDGMGVIRLSQQWFGAAIALLLAGCTGQFDGLAESRADVRPPPPPIDEVPNCVEEMVHVGPSPLRRITNDQYVAALEMLVGVRPDVSNFAPDTENHSYLSNNTTAVERAQVGRYFDTADAIAQEALPRNRSAWFPCDLNSACIRQWVTNFGKLAFRRPLESEEIDTLVSIYDDLEPEVGADAAAEQTLAAILSSPQFLYVLEGAAESEIRELDAYAWATRASLFLWNEMPDRELVAAADAGELDDPAGRVRHVERMLDAPKWVDEGLGHFFAQWLWLDHPEATEKDRMEFPDFSAALADSMRESNLRFAQGVVRGGSGTLHELLTSPRMHVDAAMASLLNVPAPASGFEVIELDDRHGLLTQPRLLAATSKSADESKIIRGLLVRRQMLCGDVDLPPQNIPEVDDRLAELGCVGCHRLMDPIGASFGQFDAIGRFVSEPVETGGRIEFEDPNERAIEFRDVGELAEILSTNEDVDACFSRQMFRFAFARREAAADSCTVDQLAQQFDAMNGSVRELAIAIAMSDALRYVRGTEGG
ncbi:MAG: DUF1592 domain-containing protein [Myxococcota bacterium]